MATLKQINANRLNSLKSTGQSEKVNIGHLKIASNTD